MIPKGISKFSKLNTGLSRLRKGGWKEQLLSLGLRTDEMDYVQGEALRMLKTLQMHKQYNLYDYVR